MNTPTDPLEKNVLEIIARLFAYGVDWTEYRDKGGPNGDHDVATYAAKIKTEFTNEVVNDILALIHTREKQARVDELNLMDFRVEQASSGVGLLRFEDSIIRPYVEKRLATLNKEQE